MTAQDDDQRTLVDEVVTPADLAELRRHVLRLAERAGLDGQRAEDFAVAVNEAVTNAIEHAGGVGELAVIQDDQRRLIAEVRDAGRGLPCSIRLTLPPPDASGGRGLWLAEELTDNMQVHSSHRGTTVRLEMTLPSPG